MEKQHDTKEGKSKEEHKKKQFPEYYVLKFNIT